MSKQTLKRDDFKGLGESLPDCIPITECPNCGSGLLLTIPFSNFGHFRVEKDGKLADEGFFDDFGFFVSEHTWLVCENCGKAFDLNGREEDFEENSDLRLSFLQRKQRPITKDSEPGRNDPCLCGSGKKYKYCCGR